MTHMRRSIAVAATGQQALDAGLAVADEGGNAVDAALAAAIVAGATEPGIVNLLGGAYVSVWPAHGEPVVIDGNVEMPGRGLPPERFGRGVREIVTEYGGGVTLYAGPGSVATPGVVPAFALASQRHGALPWSRVVEPAAAACRDGYPLSRASATYLAYVHDSLFSADAQAREVITRPDGSPLAAGELTTNHRLAETLDRLAVEGTGLFVTGAVGRAMVADLAAHDGLVTAADLAAYRPVLRTPVRRTVGDWDIAVNPPPSVGGPMLAVMLGALARCSDRRPGRRSEWGWQDAIEIQRAVLGHRIRVHDLSRDLEAAGDALLAAVERYGLEGLPTSPSTAHVSAVDGDGNACAITLSSGYHSGTCVPDTGLLCNNALGEVELNRLGLHALAPGTRLASNMAPTVARTGDGRVLAIGSPGADRITTALMLVLGQGCLHGADLQHAISAPRLHVRIRDDDRVSVEHEADAGIASAVAALGLPGHASPEPHLSLGGVGAACRGADGSLEAAGDGRREAAVGVRG